jgi:hypothetical protein
MRHSSAKKTVKIADNDEIVPEVKKFFRMT